MTIVKRGVKGTALTYEEMDENIRDLYEDTTIDRVLENGNTTTKNITTTGTISAGGVDVSLTQGNIKIQNLDVVGSAFSDAGIIFDGTSSIKSGVFTEVNGELLSYAINVSQIDDLYNSVRSGGIFRLDTRASQNVFTVISRAANTTTEVEALTVNLNTRDLKFDSGYGTAGLAYGCRAWVNFNGTTNTNLTGTYTRTSPSTTVTITATAHGLIVGSSVNLDFTTGTGVDGIYTVVTVANANTFTITTVASTTTSGNVTILRNTILGSGNISSVSDNGTGDYTVNFTTPMPDANYCVVTNAAATGSVDFQAPIKAINNSASFSIYVSNGATPTDSSVVCVAVFR
jgi:hypothetical protein